MNLTGLFEWSGVADSARWAGVVNLLCLLGGLAAIVSAVLHVRISGGRVRPGPASTIATRLPIAVVCLAFAAMLTSVWNRGIEVNHFPSQTMSEVIQMFTLAMLFSMIVLHFALGLQRRGPGWAVLDDVLIALVLVAGVFLPHMYVQTLPTAQRDLPPALQSYWFAPHLTSLIFSYATMGIAALIALSFFLTRFWSRALRGKWGAGQLATLALLVLVPFVHLLTIPLLAVSGLVFLTLKLAGRLPGEERLVRLEKDLDDVSFRAFAVGIPFLTAGLWMGAFWAQEAWANYWGWDSKENTALITWLVYVVYIHLRMLGGYRGSKAMSVLVGGALSVFLTFQIFGYLPDSQKSLHRYTDDNVRPMEGQQGANEPSNDQARAAPDGGGER